MRGVAVLCFKIRHSKFTTIPIVMRVGTGSPESSTVWRFDWDHSENAREAASASVGNALKLAALCFLLGTESGSQTNPHLQMRKGSVGSSEPYECDKHTLLDQATS